MATRDPFVALDAGTDVRAHARRLRRVWEAAREGRRPPQHPRAVIAQSWSRLERAGLDAERRAHGEAGNPISMRAQVSRLRRVLGALLAARPYRLLAGVTADFLAVERLLAAGDVHGALRAHRAPLLVESDAPRIVQARNELEGALRRAALAGGPDALWAWLQSESGRDDLAAQRDFVRAAAEDDPRRAVAAARLRALQMRWAQAG